MDSSGQRERGKKRTQYRGADVFRQEHRVGPVNDLAKRLPGSTIEPIIE